MSNANPVSATNPNPPACSPQTSGSSQNGTQCPANKLVITPAAPIPSGTTFTVTVDHTGRPGVQHDATPPVVTYSGNAGTYTVDEDVSITCSASDPEPGSGLDSSTCEDVSGPAYSFGLGSHTFSASATDVAGNTGTGRTTFTVVVTFDSLANLVDRFSTDDDVTAGLTDKLAAAASAKNAKTRANQLTAFQNQVQAQSGKALPAVQAELLIDLAEALR